MHLLSCFTSCTRKSAAAAGDGARCPSALSPALPIMESCMSEALTNTWPVEILSGDSQPWRVANPQDQPLLSQLTPGCLTPLTLLGEGAYGCVELCRVAVPVLSPSLDNAAADLQPLEQPPPPSRQHRQRQRRTNTPSDMSSTSQPTVDSCDDVLASHHGYAPIMDLYPPRSVTTSTSAAAAAAAVLAAPHEAAACLEGALNPQEDVNVRSGHSPMSSLRISHNPPISESPALSPCATPLAQQLNLSRYGPLRASAPTLVTAGPVTVSGINLPSDTSPTNGLRAAGSGPWPATPSSPSPLRPLATAAAMAESGGFFGRGMGFGGFIFRTRSSGSAGVAAAAPLTHSAPTSARSPREPPPSPSEAKSSKLARDGTAASTSALLSNELVVAVKRLGYRTPPGRPAGGGGRDMDGGVICTGGPTGNRGVHRGGGGTGPSRTRLQRMHAIELLQLARCRECPFIVRVFGCVQDDEPSRLSVAAGGGGCGGAQLSRPSPRPLNTSSRRVAPVAPAAPSSSSSSSSSCRIVMEWAEGGDLGSLIKTLSSRRSPCSDPFRERLLMGESSARFYLACLLEALSFLHGKGLLHRDVKPANLLLTSDGRAKLGDLGMVCHLDREGTAVGRAGTPNYMAPEVWAYGTGPKYTSYGATADLWSAGVVLFEMLTGRLPASHPDEYLHRNWTCSIRHPSLSTELRDLLFHMLVPRPRRRLQSCAEVAAHPWFANFDWQGLRDGSLPAPYVPSAHRPLTGGGRCRVSTAATANAAGGGGGWSRLSPPGSVVPVAGGLASAQLGIMRGPCDLLMPPVLEENGMSVATAGDAADCGQRGLSAGRGVGIQAAATRAVFRTSSAPLVVMAAKGNPAAERVVEAVPAPSVAAAVSSPRMGVAAGTIGGGGAAAGAAAAVHNYDVQSVSDVALVGMARSLWEVGATRSPRSGSGGLCKSDALPSESEANGVAAAVIAGAIASETSVSAGTSLGWPTASRPRNAASISESVSVTSSTLSASTCHVPNPRGEWPRRGESHGSGYCRRSTGATAATSNSGGGGMGFGIGFLGAALCSAFTTVITSPKASAVVAVDPAPSSYVSGSGVYAFVAPRESPEGPLHRTVGSGINVAASLSRRCTASAATAAASAGGSSSRVSDTGCGRGDVARCVPSAVTSFGGSIPLQLSTSALTATATGSDCGPLRRESFASAAGSTGSAGSIGDEGRGPVGALHHHYDHEVTGKRDSGGSGRSVSGDGRYGGLWRTAVANGSFATPIQSKAVPTESVMEFRYPLRQPAMPTKGSLASGANASCRPPLPPPPPLPLLDTGSDARGLKQPAGTALMNAAAAVRPRPPLAQPSSLLGALASSLQLQVHGLGPAGRRAGGWVQRRLADAAALAAALPDQIQSAAAAVGAVMSGSNSVGVWSAPSSPLVDTALGTVRGCKSESGRAGGFGAAHRHLGAERVEGGLVILAVAADREGATFDGSGGVCSELGPLSKPLERAPTLALSRTDLNTPAALVVTRRSSSCGGDAGNRQSGGGGRLGAECSVVEGTGIAETAVAKAATMVACRATTTHAGGVGATAKRWSVSQEGASAGTGVAGAGSCGGSAIMQSCGEPPSCQEPCADVTVVTAEVAPRGQGKIASPRLPHLRRPHSHTRSGSFCFDPLDQSRPVGQASNSLPTLQPQLSQGCNQRPSPRQQSHHARTSSFSFDVGGLLSAGLLLSGSPVLLSGAAAASTTETKYVAQTCDSSLQPPAALPAQGPSAVAAEGVKKSSPPATAAAIIAIAAAAAAVSSSSEVPLPLVGAGDDSRILLPAVGACCSPSAPSRFATTAAATAPGLLRNIHEDTGDAASPSALATVPRDKLELANAVREEPLTYAAPTLERFVPPWNSGEAAVLLYAACAAVLVVAWAVIWEGTEAAAF